jgi:hypothetical protein
MESAATPRVSNHEAATLSAYPEGFSQPFGRVRIMKVSQEYTATCHLPPEIAVVPGGS